MIEQEIITRAKTVQEKCLAYRSRLLSRVITGIYDTALQPLGITVSQAGILAFLLSVEQTSCTDISRRLLLEKSTVSRNVERLKKNGWIMMVEGGRGVYREICVTEQGKQLLKKAYGEWEQAQQRTLELLGRDGAESIYHLHETVVRRITENIG